MTKTGVLFLCTGNSARSQMAEAFLRKHGGGDFEAFSAGLEPKGISPYTHRVIAEAGLNLEGQQSKHVDEYLGKMHFDHVITVCANAEEKCPVFPGATRREHWPIEDPARDVGNEDDRLRAYRRARDEIERRVRDWVAGQLASEGGT